MPENKLKIGIDFHGVITTNTKFFAEFTKLAISKGHEIHIITGGPSIVIKKMLNDWNIQFTAIYAILDYYDALDEVEYFDNGEFYIKNELWDTAKAAYCQDTNIDIHIDDSNVYSKWFSTPYCEYDSLNKQCILREGNQIDLSQSAEKTLDQILDFSALQKSRI